MKNKKVCFFLKYRANFVALLAGFLFICSIIYTCYASSEICDGTVAFYGEKGHLCLINPDGTDFRILKQRFNEGRPGGYSWSPDGKWIAFGCGWPLGIIDTKTGKYKILAKRATDFTWSYDSKKIAYVEHNISTKRYGKCDDYPRHYICVVDIENPSNKICISPNASTPENDMPDKITIKGKSWEFYHITDVAWSPLKKDGTSEVVFVAYLSELNKQEPFRPFLFRVNSDGKGVEALTTEDFSKKTAEIYSPLFSPDGSKIAFSCKIVLPDKENGRSNFSDQMVILDRENKNKTEETEVKTYSENNHLQMRICSWRNNKVAITNGGDYLTGGIIYNQKNKKIEKIVDFGPRIVENIGWVWRAEDVNIGFNETGDIIYLSLKKRTPKDPPGKKPYSSSIYNGKKKIYSTWKDIMLMSVYNKH